METSSELPKAYDHTQVENTIYEAWLKTGYFNPDNLPNAESREPFVISLPPPNVTGTLHMGHAFEDSMQDIVIRFQRMLGKRALWLPGTDHAPIATESKVVKLLEKEEGKRKRDFTREEFVEKVKKFAQESHDTIVNQVRSMGASVDWSREAYTFDEPRNLAVRTAFKRMFDQGLIYRGYRVVNWDPKGQTVISDDEVVYQERQSKLYPFKDSQDLPIAISTTRPETKLGDTAVAVHPEDPRYKKYIGQEYDADFCGVKLHIKIVADESVEKDFGTGALGVTPAHSSIDFEMSQRHNLPMVQIIDEYGKMTVGPEGVLGKKTAEAREAVVAWLKTAGLLIKEEDTTQNVSTAERTGAVIEPLPKLQWFIAVNKPFPMPHSKIDGIAQGQEVTLKSLMKKVVENGQVEIVPERFSKIYFHWIDNLRDWCISRQLWFGHQIPVWYKGEEIFCDTNPPQGEGWQQDSDTLDTWFSSGLWTFSTLGWPNETQDLKTYHPTSVMMPGYEILFFWVARMILMSTYLLGEIPFKKVVLHGIVRDSKGRKFSKSLNNGVDPLEMTAKYGTDALRIALIFGSGPGNDTVFDEQKVKGMKHFANKLWNIARFIMTNVETSDYQFEAKTEADKQIIAQLETATQSVTKDMENFMLHEAAQGIYQFVWHELADIYLEKSKEQLKDTNLKANTEKILLHQLIQSLKLLHPFMPFITEHIWQMLKERRLVTTDWLMVAEWPKS